MGRQLPSYPGRRWAEDCRQDPGKPPLPPAQRYLEMFLNVLPVVGDPTGSDAGLSHQLKTDLPTQVVRDVPFLAREKQSWVRSPAAKKRGLGGGTSSEREAGKTAEVIAWTKTGLRQAAPDGERQKCTLGHTHLPPLIHLREELVHVRQVFVLKEEALEDEGTPVYGAYGSPGREPRRLPPHGCCGRSLVAPVPSQPPAGIRTTPGRSDPA